MGLFGKKTDELEALRKEMNAYGDGLRQDRGDLLMRSRTKQCQYHPDNGGTGRKAGDPRHFGDSIEDVLGGGR